MRPKPEQAKPGQESVWDFPRPAIAQARTAHVTIVHEDLVLADSRATVRTLETSHPPSYYIPRNDIRPGILKPNASRGTVCEWKGEATYWDVVLPSGTRFEAVGWSYASPSTSFASLRDHIAFYAAPFDLCTVDGESVTPQPGEFYGGWITSRFAGPFKGVPGSWSW